LQSLITMKKRLIFFLVALALISVGVYFSLSKPASSQGRLEADRADYDFGTIPMNGGNVTYEFALENKSGEPVTIEEVSTSCMCTTAFVSHQDHNLGPFGMSGHNIQRKANVTVQPGERMIVKAVFDPAAHGPAGAGSVSRTIYLSTNSKTQPTVNLAFTANVAL